MYSQKYSIIFVRCHPTLFIENDIKFFTRTFEFIVFTLAHTLTQLKYTLLTCCLSVSPFVPLCAVQTFPKHSHLQGHLILFLPYARNDIRLQCEAVVNTSNEPFPCKKLSASLS